MAYILIRQLFSFRRYYTSEAAGLQAQIPFLHDREEVESCGVLYLPGGLLSEKQRIQTTFVIGPHGAPIEARFDGEEEEQRSTEEEKPAAKRDWLF